VDGTDKEDFDFKVLTIMACPFYQGLIREPFNHHNTTKL